MSSVSVSALGSLFVRITTPTVSSPTQPLAIPLHFPFLDLPPYPSLLPPVNDVVDDRRRPSLPISKASHYLPSIVDVVSNSHLPPPPR